MEIVIKTIDAFEISGDVLVLKHAQALYGLDRAVVNLLSGVQTNIEKELPLPNSEFITNSEPIGNFKKILFIGVPSLHEFQYNEIEDFVYRALSNIQKILPSPKTAIFTLHGKGDGLDVEKAFLSELEGIKKFVQKNGTIPKLEQIIFVERDENTAKSIAPALEKFLVENRMIFNTDLSGLNKESFEIICKAINEGKAKSPSDKNFGINELLKILNQKGTDSKVKLEVQNILERLIQFEQRITEIEHIDKADFLFEELNPAYLDIQLCIQKIDGKGYQEIAWIIQLYTLSYLRQICRRNEIIDSYFLKKKEETMNQIKFRFLNYFGQLLIPSNNFPWFIVNDVMNASELSAYWEKFENINTL